MSKGRRVATLAVLAEPALGEAEGVGHSRK
jgi:hypothetical protein